MLLFDCFCLSTLEQIAVCCAQSCVCRGQTSTSVRRRAARAQPADEREPQHSSDDLASTTARWRDSCTAAFRVFASHSAFMPPDRTGPGRAVPDWTRRAAGRIVGVVESLREPVQPRLFPKMIRGDQRMRSRLGARGSVSARLAAFAARREKKWFLGTFFPSRFSTRREKLLCCTGTLRATRLDSPRFLLIPRKRAAREDPGGLPHRSALLDHVTIPGSPRRSQTKRLRERNMYPVKSRLEEAVSAAAARASPSAKVSS